MKTATKIATLSAALWLGALALPAFAEDMVSLPNLSYRTGPFAAPADPPGQVADPPKQRHRRERSQGAGVAVEESPDPGLLAGLHAPSSAALHAVLNPGTPPGRPSLESAPWTEFPEGCRSG